MGMTFSGYIDNPMGKKNSVFSQRDMYKNLYTSKMDKIILREGSKFTYKLYVDEAKDRYYCHVKVPSEVIENFYYDTVVEFYTDMTNLIEKGKSNLNHYYIKFYSNDPAFVYTFAHAFITNDLFIKDLEPKMTKEAVKKPAKVKNPQNIVGYVKSIYFAYLIMKRYSLFEKANYKAYGSKYKKDLLLKDVMPAGEKVALRQEAQAKLDAANKRERINTSNERRDSQNLTNKSQKISITNKITNTSKTSSTKITKTIKKK